MSEYTAAVRRERATELERLGSDRGLIALTGADLSPASIRRTIAAGDLAVANALSSWDGEGWADAAETVRTHADRVAEPLSDPVAPADGDPIADYLAACESDAERAGAALLGYPLIADGRYLQAVSFFVQEADEDAADEFRAVRSTAESLLERGEQRVGATDDPDAAVTAATELIDAVYEWYVGTLEGMGLDPKTVC